MRPRPRARIGRRQASAATSAVRTFASQSACAAPTSFGAAAAKPAGQVREDVEPAPGAHHRIDERGHGHRVRRIRGHEQQARVIRRADLAGQRRAERLALGRVAHRDADMRVRVQIRADDRRAKVPGTAGDHDAPPFEIDHRTCPESTASRGEASVPGAVAARMTLLPRRDPCRDRHDRHLDDT